MPGIEELQNSPLILGFATFGNGDYQTLEEASVNNAVEAVDTALSSPYFKAIDTSPWYYPSEQTLGEALHRLKEKHQRKSYFLISKCGRYRPADSPKPFDYSIAKLKHSVNESLKRLQTDYLDLILLHDVEFVAEPIGKATAAGQPTDALAHPDKYGLSKGDAGKIHGPGDQSVIDAIRFLFTLKEQGLVKNVGLSGFPLPVLARIAILVKSQLNRPLDAILSYSQHTPLSFPPGAKTTNLQQFLPLLTENAGVDQIINASPLGMGIFRTCGAPPWHPASPQAKEAVATCVPLVGEGVELADVALQFGLKPISTPSGVRIPTVVGLSNAAEAVASIAAYDKCINETTATEKVDQMIAQIQSTDQAGLTWESGRQSE